MTFENPNLFFVSGGPGCGKTTLLRELQKLGYDHAPEVARQITATTLEVLPKTTPAARAEFILERIREKI
jgi:predicted ATPase